MKILTKRQEEQTNTYIRALQEKIESLSNDLAKTVNDNLILKTQVEQLSKINFDLNSKNIKLREEIKKLKENVRDAYNLVDERQVQAVAIAIEDEAKSKKKTVKKVVNEIVEESKEKKSTKTKNQKRSVGRPKKVK